MLFWKLSYRSYFAIGSQKYPVSAYSTYPRPLTPGASICFQRYEGPKSLLSPPVTSPFLLFASLIRSPPFPLPLTVAPLIQLGSLGMGSDKLPQWGLGRSPEPPTILVHILRVKKRCWWHSRCTVSNNRKRL